jgi:hypothetical protein
MMEAKIENLTGRTCLASESKAGEGRKVLWLDFNAGEVSYFVSGKGPNHRYSEIEPALADYNTRETG